MICTCIFQLGKSPFSMELNRSSCVDFARAPDDGRGLGVGPVLVALHGLEVELDPEALVGGIEQRVGVRAIAVHVAYGGRQAAIRHQDRDLMQALRRQRPEIPHRGRRAHVGLRMALLRVDEVGELVGVADEEHRRVVADEIPVAFGRVELQSEAAHVALGIGGAELAGDRREARQHVGLGAGLQHLRLRVLGDVAGDRQRAEGTPALGVHGTLGDALAVLVRELLDQLIVLQEHRPARSRGHRILVVGDRCTRRGGHDRLVGHHSLLCPRAK